MVLHQCGKQNGFIAYMEELLGLPYFEKQKSGHWMTNFHETKFMAPATFFLSKAGRGDAVAGLIIEVMVQI